MAAAAARAAGALIGGAIASQNQGYYDPAVTYPVYSDPGYGGYNYAAPVVYNNGDFRSVLRTNLPIIRSRKWDLSRL